MFFYLIYLLSLGIYMFVKRFNAVKSRRINPKYFLAYDFDSPKDLRIMENHFTNQFQVPILFLITNVLALQTQAVTGLFFILACGFVLTRMIHSYIHLGPNIVLARAGIFFLGYFIILAQWTVILSKL